MTSWSPTSDHSYKVKDHQNLPVSPGEALSAGRRLDSVIVVAAAGGGIQAAAWTARVLTGLDHQAREAFPADPRIFEESLRMVSAVSGGSVGAMYFVDAYDPSGGGLPDDLERIVNAAETSTLDDLAWGLVYVDFWRPILPVPYDRSRAFEWALARNGAGERDALWHGMGEWRKGVREGFRPAVIMNATLVETGERLLLSTTDMKPAVGRRTLSERIQSSVHPDVSVVTAARLSSTFPFVSPAARAKTEESEFHVVDGGYADNYGIASLIDWLNEALSAPNNPVKRVLILEVRAAPAGATNLPDRAAWTYQAYAPLLTLLHVRDSDQFARDEEELRYFTTAWKTGGVIITTASFEYPGERVPLSWHLTPKEKAAIEHDWQTISHGPEWELLKDYLSGP